MRHLLVVVTAMAVLIAGCDAGEWVGGSPDDARRIAEQFLEAVAAGDTDTAWSLMYPPSRTARFGDDRAVFDAILDRIDMSDVIWEVTTASSHDGHYHVEFRLRPLAIDDALAVFLQVSEDHATMQVDIEPLSGASGVVGG